MRLRALWNLGRRDQPCMTGNRFLHCVRITIPTRARCASLDTNILGQFFRRFFFRGVFLEPKYWFLVYLRFNIYWKFRRPPKSTKWHQNGTTILRKIVKKSIGNGSIKGGQNRCKNRPLEKFQNRRKWVTVVWNGCVFFLERTLIRGAFFEQKSSFFGIPQIKKNRKLGWPVKS